MMKKKRQSIISLAEEEVLTLHCGHDYFIFLLALQSRNKNRCIGKNDDNANRGT